MKIHDIKQGTILTNEQLMKSFGVANAGGMRKSTANNCLVLISDHTKGIYDDKWYGNEIHYTGMGLNGNQSLDYKQNKTLYNAKDTNTTLYLFEVFEKNQYTYQGIVELSKEPYKELQEDINGISRTVWMFPLTLKNSSSVISAKQFDSMDKRLVNEAKKMSLNELKELAQKYSSKQVPTRMVVSNVFDRNVYISEYTKVLANGICQLCGQEAPFKDKQGKPYLESHHIIWLANNGEDSIENTVALCPNCHRKMHIINDPNDVKFLQEKNKLNQL